MYLYAQLIISFGDTLFISYIRIAGLSNPDSNVYKPPSYCRIIAGYGNSIMT